MLQLATVDVGCRFRPIPRDLGLIFSCKKLDTENGYVVEDMCDQDYVHNHKKLLNPLDHASRVLRMGEYLVHMNHLQLVSEVFPFVDHGLGISDIERRDRQNWRSAQKLTFPKIQECLEALINGTCQGRPPDITLLGTKTYLLIIWYYVEIFCSYVASLTTRIKYAAIVTHFPCNLAELDLSAQKLEASCELYLQRDLHRCHFILSFCRDAYRVHER